MMRIEIYADGADMNGIVSTATNPAITGFTTNPTLMRKAGVTNYEEFAKDVMQRLKYLRPDTNISLEVFADDHAGMVTQAQWIHKWARYVGYMAYVKIPITNTLGYYSFETIKTLTGIGIPCNITAVCSPCQVHDILPAIDANTPTIISVFAGRIADSGINPVGIMRDCLTLLKESNPLHYGSYYATHKIKLLWASPREAYNVIQADEIGCDIITLTDDLIKKLKKVGVSLTDVSLDTVNMFYNDAKASGYTIEG